MEKNLSTESRVPAVAACKELGLGPSATVQGRQAGVCRAFHVLRTLLELSVLSAGLWVRGQILVAAVTSLKLIGWISALLIAYEKMGDTRAGQKGNFLLVSGGIHGFRHLSCFGPSLHLTVDCLLNACRYVKQLLQHIYCISFLALLSWVSETARWETTQKHQWGGSPWAHLCEYSC